MVLHSTDPLNYIAHHNKVKLPTPGFGRDDGQRLRAAYCAACRTLLGRAMLMVQCPRPNAC